MRLWNKKSLSKLRGKGFCRINFYCLYQVHTSANCLSQGMVQQQQQQQVLKVIFIFLFDYASWKLA